MLIASEFIYLSKQSFCSFVEMILEYDILEYDYFSSVCQYLLKHTVFANEIKSYA